jgi:hypothetical protein
MILYECTIFLKQESSRPQAQSWLRDFWETSLEALSTSTSQV